MFSRVVNRPLRNRIKRPFAKRNRSIDHSTNETRCRRLYSLCAGIPHGLALGRYSCSRSWRVRLLSPPCRSRAPQPWGVLDHFARDSPARACSADRQPRACGNDTSEGGRRSRLRFSHNCEGTRKRRLQERAGTLSCVGRGERSHTANGQLNVPEYRLRCQIAGREPWLERAG